jgi:hypothetical protein
MPRCKMLRENASVVNVVRGPRAHPLPGWVGLGAQAAVAALAAADVVVATVAVTAAAEQDAAADVVEGAAVAVAGSFRP